MTIAIVGGTSEIAEQCARLWLTEVKKIILIGRNHDKLKRVADDLRVRGENVAVEVLAGDLTSPEFINSTTTTLFANQQSVQLAFIAHGVLHPSPCRDLAGIQNMLAVNGVSPALWAEAMAEHMNRREGGTVAVVASVAGERARKSNYVYGAGKALARNYVEGLRHRYFNTHVDIRLIQPGPTLTPMTESLVGKRNLAPAHQVAKAIVSGLRSRRPVIYAPARWRWIMWVVRHLPSWIFMRTDF